MSSLTPEEARLQRVLKIVVLVLGLAILAVLGVIVSKIVGGTSRPDPVAAVGPVTGGPVIDHNLPLPEDALVVGMALGDGLLAVRYRLPSGAEEIALLDTATGALKGRVHVTRE